jgi:ADP-heptose:LPS heptosyltransferase
LRKLKEKSVNKVKRVNPYFKKLIVTLINKAGKIFFLLRKNVLPQPVKKILFISLYFNGDILFESPLFELINKLYPDAELHIWIKSRTKALMEGYPLFKQVFIFDDIRTRRYDENIKFDLRSKIKFFRILKKEKYDFIFDLTGLFWTALAVFIATARYSAGFNFHGFGFLYNFESYAITEGHLVDKNLDIILGNPLFKVAIKNSGKINLTPNYYITEDTKHKVDDLFFNHEVQSNSKKIAIHTTAGWKAKSWDVSNFISLINEFDDKFDIFLIGGNEDMKNAETIIKKITKKIYNFTGRLSINESSEVIRRSDFFIGADSGPLYIAEAVGTKTISLFGPTNPLFSSPRGIKHSYIYKELFCSADKNEQNCKLMAGLNCKTHDCMKEITVSDLLSNFENN